MNEFGQTPLWMAINEDNEDAAKLFLAAGASPDKVVAGKDPVILAYERGFYGLFSEGE